MIINAIAIILVVFIAAAGTVLYHMDKIYYSDKWTRFSGVVRYDTTSPTITKNIFGIISADKVQTVDRDDFTLVTSLPGLYSDRYPAKNILFKNVMVYHFPHMTVSNTKQSVTRVDITEQFNRYARVLDENIFMLEIHEIVEFLFPPTKKNMEQIYFIEGLVTRYELV